MIYRRPGGPSALTGTEVFILGHGDGAAMMTRRSMLKVAGAAAVAPGVLWRRAAGAGEAVPAVLADGPAWFERLKYGALDEGISLELPAVEPAYCSVRAEAKIWWPEGPQFEWLPEDRAFRVRLGIRALGVGRAAEFALWGRRWPCTAWVPIGHVFKPDEFSFAEHGPAGLDFVAWSNRLEVPFTVGLSHYGVGIDRRLSASGK